MIPRRFLPVNQRLYPAPQQYGLRSFRLRQLTAPAIELLLAFVLCFSGTVVAQTTIHIPVDQPTIQAGINAANNGDTVLVAPGTYYENIDFKGKGITVTSSAGAATTLIDGGSKGPAVSFRTTEPRTAVLSNLTIQHGGTFEGYTTQPIYASGGIVVSNSSPTILNNVITLNNCWDIEVTSAAPLIQGNEISSTEDPKGQCSFGGGSAIYIGGNLNYGSGSAVSAFIVGNTLENNVESGLEDAGGNGGAGITIWGGSPVIENNVIRNNSSPGGSGGAINIQDGGDTGTVIVQNLIYGNQAGCGGGAIAFNTGYVSPPGFDVLVANNTIVNNTGQATGGYSECASISQFYPSPDSYGEGRFTAVFVNNIVSGSTSYPAINCGWFETPTEWQQPIFDHNILVNAGGAFFGSFCIDVSAKYGNLTADPRFANAATNDFRLTSGSPAIDSGNNSVLQSIAQLTGTPLSKDFANNTRVQDATGKGYPTIDMGAYEFGGAVDASPTTIVLTSSSYFGNAGSNYALTATFSSSLGVPTGTASFFLDGKMIGASTINSGGVATFSNFLMPPGSNNLYVSYQGQGAFTPATSVIIIVDINLYSTSVALTSSANPANVGQPVTFSVTTLSSDSTIIPSPITLTDSSSNTTLATLIPNSAGIATYTTSNLTLGYHFINATYAGDSTHGPASASLSQQIIAGATTSTALVPSVNPAAIGQMVTFTATVTNASNSGTPTGSITLTTGTTALTQPLTAVSGNSATTSFSISTLTAGSHSVTASYTPSGSFAASSATLTEVINGIASATSLTAAPNPALFGNAVTLAAAVTGSSATPTGAITFYDGAISLARGTLDTTGHAAFTTSTLSVGTHFLTAVYAGDSSYNPSTAQVVSEIIQPLPQDFAIVLASPTITIQTQHHTTTSVNLTSLNGFADTLALTCGNLPTYVTCQLTPASSVLASNATASVVLYLDTDSVLGYAHNVPPGRSPLAISLALLLAPFSLFAGAIRRRNRQRFGFRLLVLFLAILPISLALSGCGEIITPYLVPPSATPGTYIIPITGTGATTGITHSAQLTLHITP
jgi:hypothetical protein